MGGMTEESFWNSEYWVIANRIEAYMDREKREWQRVSLLASYVVKPYVKKGSKVEPTDIAPWAWPDGNTQKARRATPQDLEAFRKMDEKMIRLHEQKKNGKK